MTVDFCPQVEDARLCRDCYSGNTLVKLHDAYEVSPLAGVKCRLPFGVAKRNADVAAVAEVDLFHHVAELFSVGRGVFDFSDKNAEVYHFVQQDVFYFVFGNVKEGADRDDGRMPTFFKQSFFGSPCKFASKGACFGKPYDGGGQLSVKAEVVEVIEFFLQKRECWLHIFIFVMQR